MKNVKVIITVFFLSIIQLGSVYAKKTLQITDFGAYPDSWNDVLPAIKEALNTCQGLENITLNFPKGRYDLWPSFCEGKLANIGLDMRNLKNITIEGNGSELIFHGCMSIALISSCENITIQNFSVDWDRPFLSQVDNPEHTHPVSG